MDTNNIYLRRLAPGDAGALAVFYNGLCVASKRTFRPLGVTTTVELCEEIVAANCGLHPTKYDLVAVRDAIVGWGFIWGINGQDPASEPMFGLAVADAYHGQGIGTRLITSVMTWARGKGLPAVVLTVVQDNAVAWRLYEKQGFVRYGEHVGEDGLPYYRMRADLAPRSGSGAQN